VLTNTFPLSSRWVAFSSLFSSGRCYTSEVSSSCPSTAATTWYCSLRSTTTTTVVGLPAGGELDDGISPRQKRNTRVYPATLLAGGDGDGATVARQEAAPHRLSNQSEVTTLAPLRGTCWALPSHLRQRQMSPPRNGPTPSGLMTPVPSRRTCWALASYLTETVQSVPDATSPPSIDQKVPSVFHPVPFRFSFDPPSDPASVSTFARAYPDLLGYHMWSSWDRLTSVSTFGPAGSEEEDDPDVSWDFSGLRDPSAMRDFMSACDHCLSGCSDDGHNLDDEGCDPTRECYHIDQEDHDGENHLGMPGSDDALAPVSRVEIPRELAVVQVPAGVRTHSLSNSVRCRPSSTKKRGDLCSSGKTSSRSG
jgi:hypothetical protein